MNARRWLAWGNLALAALLMLVVWVLLVWVSARPALKTLIDLTPQRINSVDPATIDLLAELRAERATVEFHLFFPPMQGGGQDDASRQWLAIGTRLRDLTRILLRRYQWLGGEGVTIVEHDLYTDVTRTREAAQRFDYKTAELDTLVVAVTREGREPRHTKLSLLEDLALIDLPSMQPGVGPPRAAVPVLKDYKGEEQISSAMKGLLVQGSPIAYFLDGYSPGVNLDGASGADYGGFRNGLHRAGFDVRNFNLQQTGRVPPDAALVLVMEPRREFSDGDAQALFDYVQRGGRLFLNYSLAGLPDWNPTGGKLGELLGYELSVSPVFHLIRDRGGRTGGRGIDGPGVDKLQLGASSSHPVTRRFVTAGRALEVAAARALQPRDGAAKGVRPPENLLVTGPDAWLARTDPRDGMPDLRQPQVDLRPFVVGMSISVDVEDTKADPGSGAPRTGEVVVISGVFCNNTGLGMFGDLALNVCNWMAERRVLLDIQGSRYEAKHLQLVPQQLDRVHNLLVWGVPGTFFVLGFVVFFVRRRV